MGPGANLRFLVLSGFANPENQRNSRCTLSILRLLEGFGEGAADGFLNVLGSILGKHRFQPNYVLEGMFILNFEFFKIRILIIPF